MNPFRKMKLKSKLRNCDYKLAGTVIKQQYYNENSHTEINRMIDHFMEEPGFDRALDLIEYNEMIVFYFTESCTDGLYVRKAPVESSKSTTQTEAVKSEKAPLQDFEESHSVQAANELSNVEKVSTHSEHLQKIQESEEWMDQMINRLARKPKLPTVTDNSMRITEPSPVKVYDESELQSFDTIEFKTVDSIKETEIIKEPKKAEIEVFYETEVYKEAEDSQETKENEEIEVFRETEEFKDTVEHEEQLSALEPSSKEDNHSVQEEESKAAFNFVASAESSKHWNTIESDNVFTSPPVPELDKKKRPKFPNVVATLNIDLHTMMKQLDEYRHQLAYHPHNEQQMIRWIESLEEAIEEFSTAIDLIEDSYE